MRRLLIIFILLLPAVAFSGSDLVTGKATPQEVYDKVVDAARYLSTAGESGLKEFSNSTGKFVWKNTHVWVTQCEKNFCLPNPKSKDIGLNLAKMKCYKTGKFYILDLCSDAMYEPEGAWIEYWFPRSGYDKPQRKISFMMPVSEMRYQVVSGIFDDTTKLADLNKISNNE
jgi:hypothetical protein